MPARFGPLALAVLLLAPEATAQPTLGQVVQRTEAEVRAFFGGKGLTESELTFLVDCTARANEQEEGYCDEDRLVRLVFKASMADADEEADAESGLPVLNVPVLPREGGVIQVQPGQEIGPVAYLPANTQLTRYAVAFGASGGWAVGGGANAASVIRGMARAGVETSPHLDPALAAFAEAAGGLRGLALGHDGVAVAIGGDGGSRQRRLTGVPVATSGAPTDFEIRPGIITSEDAQRAESDATGRPVRGGTITQGGRAPACDEAYTRLDSTLTALGRADAHVALSPLTCAWTLTARGRVHASGPADVLAGVQAMLDRGERPVIAITPDGRSYVVVSDSEVLLGPGLPESLRGEIQSVQRDRFEVTGRGTMEPVGSVHAIAFDPQRFAIAEDRGRAVVNGVILVGDGPGGYYARGVEQALCDAAQRVTGGTGSLNCVNPERDPAASGAPPEAPFAMEAGRNKLAVVVHGITPRVSDDPGAMINSHGHTGYYWGYDFMSALVGDAYDGSSGHRIEMAMASTPGASGERSIRTREVSREVWNVCSGLLPAASQCHVRRSPIGSDDPALAPVFAPEAAWTEPSGRGSFTAAMVTFRDGSQRLSQQLPAAIDQIYDTYHAHFGELPLAEQPQMYFVAHSYGGIISRAIMTPMGAGGVPLTDEQKRRAAFIRDRTVLVSTLSTPHEGSPATEIANKLADLLDGFRVGLNLPTVPDGAFPTPFLGGNDQLVAPGARVANELSDALKSGVTFISAYRDVFLDIEQQAASNATFLEPDRARRSDGSLVPVYTMNGRIPGDRYFWTQRLAFEPASVASELNLADVGASGRPGKEAAALLVTELLLQRFGMGAEAGHPWGRASGGSALNRVTTPRYSNARPLSSDLTQEGGHLAAFLLTNRNGYPIAPDPSPYDVDSDGFVGAASGHGTGLPTTSWYRTHTGYGSWMPWDIDNHGSLMFNPANGAWIYNNLLGRAGPLAGSGKFSAWENAAAPTLQSKTVRLTVSRVQALEDPDPAFGQGEADIRLVVRIGDETFRRTFADDDADVSPNVTFSHRTASDVVMVFIALRDVDGGVAGRDDALNVSPSAGREDLFFYLDTRTGQVFGDVHGVAGTAITATGRDVERAAKARVTFRVSVAP